MNTHIESLEVGDRAPVPPEPLPESEITKNWQGDRDAPLVSVVCHAFNHASYIKDALNGLLMQRTSFPFEIVVHDDASSDGTAEIISEYAASYPGVIRTILQSENQFSKGKRPSFFSFPEAKGKFIALCEGDDYWLDPNKVSVQADFLQNNPGFSVCGHDALIVENGLLLKRGKLLEGQKRDYDARGLQEGGYVLSVTAMFVNKIADFAPEHSKILNGDNLVFSRLGEFGGARYITGLVPAAYRVHPGGVWSLLGERQKTAAKLNTYFWISKYYERTGDLSMSRHYSHRVIERVLMDAAKISITDFFIFKYRFLKIYISRRFPAIFKILKKFAKK